jgi:YesN/AraC family two-component response regulator
MGVTFTDYLNNVRIKVSKDLLISTNLSLLDISLYSGFEDQSYFTKVFKKIESCTPKEYRKMMQLKNEQS